RGLHVTGVQTCALPISAALLALWMRFVRAPFRVDRRLWPWIPVQASCIYGINYLFAYGATAYVVSGIVALSFALNVVFSLLLEQSGRASWRERSWVRYA